MPEDWLNRISPCLRPPQPGASHVFCTAHDVCTPGYLMPPRVIYDHELILYEGSGHVLEIDGVELRCQRDSFVIIPPGALHSERNAEGRPGHRYWCHFDWCHQPGYERTPVMTFIPGKPAYQFCRRPPEWVPPELWSGPLPDPAAAYAQARLLARLWASRTAHSCLQARAVLLALLIELLDRAPDPIPTATVDAALPSRIRRHLDHAVERDVRALSLPRLLRDLPFSYAHLCRVFRRAYGVSPLQYVHARKIGRARILLRDSDLAIAEIAAHTGFNHPAYFAKTFRRLTGQTPGAYRRGPAR